MARNMLLITSTTSLISLVLLIRLHHARLRTIASFLLAFGIMTIRTIVITTLSIYGFPISKYIYTTHGITAIILIPLFHIHFLQLTRNRGWRKTDLLHGLPLLIALVGWPLSDFGYQGLVTTILSLVILFYWVMILRSFVTDIWNRQSQINMVMKNIRQIREISNVVFVAITIGIFYNLWILLYARPVNDEQSLRHLIVPSLILLVTSIKLLLDPDIMFGFDVVPRVIKKTGPGTVMSDIWKMERQNDVVGKRYQGIQEKMGELLKDYIPRIEKAAFQTELFRRPGLTVEEFAAEVDIPVFHMAYIFRYHSQVTFQDFKKIIQINDAIELMKAGYVKEHTMESLAAQVGFASYNPFFVSFRNITGMTPQQYHKSVEA